MMGNNKGLTSLEWKEWTVRQFDVRFKFCCPRLEV